MYQTYHRQSQAYAAFQKSRVQNLSSYEASTSQTQGIYMLKLNINMECCDDAIFVACLGKDTTQPLTFLSCTLGALITA